ncbi:SMI1/KNR4 family protein [Streptomyces litchfieldiae]|uniref:SMI1/KNR4 family protein n=1 Tax=Streptomyces litchfieldiae TaxID=3075543 RepID=A0ABU2N1Y3_9ACTN|nr:SMI1/KNR4 family protein [Streptomyces sp. DSM 44938]MDT0347622.1 SMI1/KNR4 family protein [Streptomyces sp. DSM 44938]
MVERAARRIVEKIVASAPAGWTRAVLASTAGRGGVSVSGVYDVPGASLWGHSVPSPFGELTALAEAVREVRGWERTSLEFVCRPSGEYELVAFTDAVTSLRGRGGGFQVVLDPDSRLPEPGAGEPEGSAGPAGDPELAVARFREYLTRRAAILGRPEELPPPVSAAALKVAERRVGRALPADLRALYAIADGDGIGFEHRYLFGGNGWLALEDLVAIHADQRQPVWSGWELGWQSVVFDADPPDTVRRRGGHPAWLPFATGEDGNYLAVDLSPARNGRPGQVIRIGRDYDRGPAYVADSVTSLLGRYLELLERGAYEEYDDHISLLEPAERLGPERIVGEMPGEIPPGLQAIHLNDVASPVDLGPLVAAPRLRLLHLNRCATADLAPVRALPVESLRVTVDGGDLAPLAGHPHLTSLDLGTTAPIGIAPLRTVPRLRGLDLSRAEVRDLRVLADLPDLRYLSLTARQWGALLDEGKAPPALAAVRLADDDAPLGEALAWAARLGLDTGDALRVTGALSV